MSNHQGEYLRSLRISRDVGQGELSEFLGFKNQQFLSNIERGISKIPLKYVRTLIEKLNGDLMTMRRAIIQDFADRVDSTLKLKEEAS